jgi:hypothetical protein
MLKQLFLKFLYHILRAVFINIMELEPLQTISPDLRAQMEKGDGLHSIQKIKRSEKVKP